MADVIEIDNTTNPPTITEREFNEIEKAQRAQDLLNKVKFEEEIAAKAAAKAALLEKLGITEEEARLLLG